MFGRTHHTSRACMAGCWVVQGDTLSLHCSQSNVAFTLDSTPIALLEPKVTFITTWECAIYLCLCQHCSTPTITVTMLFILKKIENSQSEILKFTFTELLLELTLTPTMPSLQ